LHLTQAHPHSGPYGYYHLHLDQNHQDSCNLPALDLLDHEITISNFKYTHKPHYDHLHPPLGHHIFPSVVTILASSQAALHLHLPHFLNHLRTFTIYTASLVLFL
jgi:hypothetical protein